MYLVTRKLHILIINLRVTIQIRCTRLCVINERVLCRILNRCINSIRTCTHHAIGTNRIVYCFIMMIDSQLKRIHLRGIWDILIDCLTILWTLSFQQRINNNRACLCLLGFLTLRHRHVDTCHCKNNNKG